jgi:hypothetical protein
MNTPTRGDEQYEVRPTNRTRKGLLISTTRHVTSSCRPVSIEFHRAGTINSIEVVNLMGKTKSIVRGCDGIDGESVPFAELGQLDLIEGDRIEVIHDHDLSITIRAQRMRR